MKISVVELVGTTDELDASELARRLIARFGSTSGAIIEDEPDDSEDDSDTEGRPVIPDTPDAVPGVTAEGQETVRNLLRGNSAAKEFLQFLREATAWPQAYVKGKKRKGSGPDEPLDYTDYLRLRKLGSQFGGFAYVYAVDGQVDLRLNYASDEELAAIAPAAERLHAGHHQYRVRIRIVDQATLDQALKLARIAYDAT